LILKQTNGVCITQLFGVKLDNFCFNTKYCDTCDTCMWSWGLQLC